MRGLVGVLGVIALLGCVPAEPRGPARQADKRELFGDAGLLPTREGERVRRELVLADELERLLARASTPATVTVSLIEPASAVVVAQTGELDQVHAIARAALPDLDASRIHVTIAALDQTPSKAPSGSLTPILIVAIGLGLALGVALERARQRKREAGR